MSSEQHMKTSETPQDEIPHFPFPFADHSLACPPEYGRLRQECPVARVHMPYGGDAFLLTRHADIAKAFVDSRCGMIQKTDGDVPRLEAGSVPSAVVSKEVPPSEARHHKRRSLLRPLFTVQHANALRPRVVKLTNELIDAMERSGPPADLLENYAIQTPMTILCELMGIPPEDEKLFRIWARSFISTTSSHQEKLQQRTKMMQYITNIIEQEGERANNTAISLLLKGHEQGDEVITATEVHSFVLTLISAGFETVSTAFTNSAFVLLQRPDLLVQLRTRVDEPKLMASAIEELLRMIPVGYERPRITREEIVLGGTTIPKGEVVLLSLVSANHDESVFAHPNEINFDRDATLNLTFGRGMHACLGQQIARMELQVLWSTLLRRLPTIRLAVAPSQVSWKPNDSLLFGPSHLPVIW